MNIPQVFAKQKLAGSTLLMKLVKNVLPKNKSMDLKTVKHSLITWKLTAKLTVKMSFFNDEISLSYVYTAYKHMEWILQVRPQRKADPKPFLNVSAVPSLHSGFLCVVSLGLNYIFMGQADEEGRGMIAPHHFIMAFKAKNQRAFNMLKNKRC